MYEAAWLRLIVSFIDDEIDKEDSGKTIISIP